MTFNKTALALLGGAALFAAPALAEESSPIVLANFSIIQDQDDSNAWDADDRDWDDEDDGESWDSDDNDNSNNNSNDNDNDDDDNDGDNDWGDDD